MSRTHRRAHIDKRRSANRSNWIGTIVDHLAALDIDHRALSRMSAKDLEWMAVTLIEDEHDLGYKAVRDNRQILQMLSDAGAVIDDIDEDWHNDYASRRASRSVTASDRKRLIRLASSLPVGSPERKAILNGLVKSAASDRSANYDREILALIHEERRVKHSWEREVSKAYNTLNNADEGYLVGEETDDIDAIREAGRLIDTVVHGQIAVYWNPSHLTLVGGGDGGPWAVDVSL
mgnify:CR=1 FL=1